MARYVETIEVKQLIWGNTGDVNLLKKIDKLPEAKVEPIVHAHWNVCGMFDDFVECSNCGWKISHMGLIDFQINRCPGCGAHMDGEKMEEG